MSKHYTVTLRISPSKVGTSSLGIFIPLASAATYRCLHHYNVRANQECYRIGLLANYHTSIINYNVRDDSYRSKQPV